MWETIWVPASLCVEKKREFLDDPSLRIVAIHCVAEDVIDGEPSCQLLIVRKCQEPYTGPTVDCC